MKAISFILNLTLLSVASAKTFVIFVAEESSAAYKAAAAKTSADSALESRLHKALDLAASKLNQDKRDVIIKVAAGSYTSKGDTGSWLLPDIQAPKNNFSLVGGYDANFEKRSPFSSPSILVISGKRSGAVIEFSGKNSKLKSFQLSGVSIDAAAGNSYDSRSNSLMKGQSSSYPLLAFGYLNTELLEISDCSFLNAPTKVAAPLIRPLSSNSKVIVRNNLFVNNVNPWELSGYYSKETLKEYVLESNSFVLSWPYNPDRTTADPGAIKVGAKQTAQKVSIRKNLFLNNVGGAIYSAYDDKNSPPLFIEENLFFRNGELFDAKTPNTGLIVGKFNRSGLHKIYNEKELKDDFSWSVQNNSSIDPKIKIATLKLKAVEYEKKLATAQSDDNEATEENQAEESDMSFEDSSSIEIKNYAPLYPYNADHLPLAQAGDAKNYGASESRVKTF